MGSVASVMMKEVQRIQVKVEPRHYDILLERGLLQRSGRALLRLLGKQRRCFVVTVPQVRRLWGGVLEASLKQSGLRVEFLEMGDGEPSKRFRTLETLAERMVVLGADRESTVIALGGGVVGDVAGFLAAIYMRGIDLVQIPTTLLAQVDASVGGKTGVNLRAGKNLAGAFHQPLAVLIDSEVLSTLPEREFRAGLYESVKCGVIGDPRLFQLMEANQSAILRREGAALDPVIAASVKLKAKVVAEDEKENGVRRNLNFGHTIGHALEAETRYRQFRHGEAVAWGMVAAIHIAQSLGTMKAADAERVTTAILGLGKLPRVNASSKRVVARLGSDKKARGGKVHFILPRRIGVVEVLSGIPDSVAIEAVEHVRRISARQ
jgi:3-dehydroquinate synthase